MRALLIKGGKGSGWFGPEHGGSHVKHSTHEEGEDVGGGKSPADFIIGQHGSVDFGEVTPDMARVMRRQAGKIRLQHGDAESGLVHIEARHGKDIRAAGYASVGEFVLDVVNHIDAVYQPGTTAQLVVVHAIRNDRIAFIQLIPSHAGPDFYTVKTAFPARAEYAKGKAGWRLLWEGRAKPSSASGSQTPFAGSPQSTGVAPTIPSWP
jgi:hypothetical protein